MTCEKPTFVILFKTRIDCRFKCYLNKEILSIGNHIKGETKLKSFKSN